MKEDLSVLHFEIWQLGRADGELTTKQAVLEQGTVLAQHFEGDAECIAILFIAFLTDQLRFDD